MPSHFLLSPNSKLFRCLNQPSHLIGGIVPQDGTTYHQPVFQSGLNNYPTVFQPFTIISKYHNIFFVFETEVFKKRPDRSRKNICFRENQLYRVRQTTSKVGKHGGTLLCHLLQDLRVPGSNIDKPYCLCIFGASSRKNDEKLHICIS